MMLRSYRHIQFVSAVVFFHMLLHQNGIAQTTQRTDIGSQVEFKVQCSVERSSTGWNVKASVATSACGDHLVSLEKEDPRDIYCISLHDDAGNECPMTEAGLVWQYDRVAFYGDDVLRPGDSRIATIDVSRFYDWKPGSYTLFVRRAVRVDGFSASFMVASAGVHIASLGSTTRSIQQTETGIGASLQTK